MKVLLVNTYHYLRGGDCTYTFSLSELLRLKGHEVFFFGMRHPQNIPCAQEKYFVDYIDFRELNSNKSISNGLRVVTRSIYSLQAKSKIAQLLEDLKPDIAHFQNIHAHLTPSIVFELKRRKIPVVWTLHDFKLICPNTHLLSHGVICESCKGGKFWQCTLKKCKKDSYAASFVASVEAIVHRGLRVRDNVDAFISPSAFLRNKFLENGYDPNKMFHLSNFCHAFPCSTSQSVDDGFALYLGQLEPWKGVKTLLQAWQGNDKVMLKIAGDGSLRTELENQLAQSRVRNVAFLGQLDRKSVLDVLSRASMVVMPSEWYENGPYSVMETMMSGKPIIASNIGGLPEMVRDGETGMLFEPGNSPALKVALDTLFNSVQLRQTMGKNAREVAIKQFDQEAHYAGLMRIYENVLSKS